MNKCEGAFFKEVYSKLTKAQMNIKISLRGDFFNKDIKKI